MHARGFAGVVKMKCLFSQGAQSALPERRIHPGEICLSLRAQDEVHFVRQDRLRRTKGADGFFSVSQVSFCAQCPLCRRLIIHAASSLANRKSGNATAIARKAAEILL
jgi:hypothetical protein